MAQVLVNEASLQDIASAIREKTGGTEIYLPSAMGAAIRALETGGGAKIASGTTSSAGTKTLIVNGIGFEPVAAFYAVNSAGQYSQYGFGSDEIVICRNVSGDVAASFTPSADGFTFSASTNLFSSSVVRTIFWFACG